MPEPSGSPKSGGPSLTSIFGVVPTIYYDLIARVAPGLAVLVALWLASGDAERFASYRKFLESNLTIVLILSYLIGMVLTGVSAIWDTLTYAVFWKLRPLRAPLGIAEAQNFLQVWEIVAQKMDAIAKATEQGGGIVTKALAESALTQNLLTALILLGSVGAVQSDLFPNPCHNLGYYFATFLLLSAAMLFRQAMFLGRVRVLYLMYVKSDA